MEDKRLGLVQNRRTVSFFVMSIKAMATQKIAIKT